MDNFNDRTIQLLGEEKFNSFANKTILIIGLGGVGGTALEALARSGFKSFILVDYDCVDITNLNRQILYTNEDVGKSKVVVAKEYLNKINSEIKCEIINTKIEKNSLFTLLKNKPDFIVDAIDYVPGKLGIYEYALKNKIPFISSLGMGNRIDPEKVIITTLEKTESCPLAKKIRHEVKLMGLNLKQINVVFSKEIPLIKSKKPSSMIMVPSTAGLLIAKYVVSTI